MSVSGAEWVGQFGGGRKRSVVSDRDLADGKREARLRCLAGASPASRLDRRDEWQPGFRWRGSFPRCPDCRTRESRPRLPTSWRAEAKRRMSPTEAMNTAAVGTLTPIGISRGISSGVAACSSSPSQSSAPPQGFSAAWLSWSTTAQDARTASRAPSAHAHRAARPLPLSPTARLGTPSRHLGLHARPRRLGQIRTQRSTKHVRPWPTRDRSFPGRNATFEPQLVRKASGGSKASTRGSPSSFAWAVDARDREALAEIYRCLGRPDQPVTDAVVDDARERSRDRSTTCAQCSYSMRCC